MNDGLDQTPSADERSANWATWANSNYPPDIAGEVKAAAQGVVARGGSEDDAYAAALNAAGQEPAANTKSEGEESAGPVPLVAELTHSKGTIGVEPVANNLILRSRGKNPLTRKEWVKDMGYALTELSSILVISPDRRTWRFESQTSDPRGPLKIDGVDDKQKLDELMSAIAERAPGLRIELAHPSFGLPDPAIKAAEVERKQAAAFNKQEEQARVLSGQRQVKVKTYDHPRDYARDAPGMNKQGWMPEGQTSNRGGVSMGGTAAKLVLTGGLGAITGLSHKGGKITVTWIRHLAVHANQPLRTIPDIPVSRTFPHEPYFEAINLAPPIPGEEYPLPPAPEVVVNCVSCRAANFVPGNVSSYICAECYTNIHLYICPHCSKVVSVKPDLLGKPIKCLSCNHSDPWPRWEKSPARASVLSTVVSRRPAGGLPPFAQSTPDEVVINCSACNKEVRVAGASSSFQCTSCGRHFRVVRCENCAAVIFGGDDLFGNSVRCLTCNFSAIPAQWDRWPAPVGMLATARPVPASTAPAAQSTETVSPVAQRLRDLQKLNEDGLLTEEEFAAKRAELIAQL